MLSPINQDNAQPYFCSCLIVDLIPVRILRGQFEMRSALAVVKFFGNFEFVQVQECLYKDRRPVFEKGIEFYLQSFYLSVLPGIDQKSKGVPDFDIKMLHLFLL